MIEVSRIADLQGNPESGCNCPHADGGQEEETDEEATVAPVDQWGWARICDPSLFRALRVAMRSTGTVIFLSGNGGMIVVQHEDGFAVVELLGDEGELQLGDRLVGDWDAVGGEKISAPGLGRTLDVYMQDNWGDREHAIKMAAKTGGGWPRRR